LIYLTGATGFVGKNTVFTLLENGHRVKALILTGEVPPFEHPQLQWVWGDIRQQETLDGYLDGVNTVVHIAGVVATADETVNYETNYLGTRNLVDLARKTKVKKFVYMSAAAVKFAHLNAYGKSKKMAEDCVLHSGLHYAILRTPLIIGKGCPEFDRFVEYVNMFPLIVPVFGDGKAIKRPVYIDDVANAILAMVDSGITANRIFEVACKEEMNLDGLIEAICRAKGDKKIKIHIPLGLSMFLAGVAEAILRDKAPITHDILTGLNEDVDFDVEESLAVLKLNPLRINDALSRTIS